MGIKITIDGSGHIIIRKKKNINLNTINSNQKLNIKSNINCNSNKIIFVRNVIDQMEIRVESIFRPGYPDVEVAYAMTGDEVIDMLHKLATGMVIKNSTPLELYTVTENKVKMIMEERDSEPKILIDVHTHPGGIAELSSKDVNAIKKSYDVFKELLPNTKIYFGVHAISDEIIGRRIEPIVSGNKIKWRSITREHEVAFFDDRCEPVEVEIWKNQ